MRGSISVKCPSERLALSSFGAIALNGLDGLGWTIDSGTMLLSMASVLVLSAWLWLENAVESRGESLEGIGPITSLESVTCVVGGNELGWSGNSNNELQFSSTGLDGEHKNKGGKLLGRHRNGNSSRFFSILDLLRRTYFGRQGSNSVWFQSKFIQVHADKWPVANSTL